MSNPSSFNQETDWTEAEMAELATEIFQQRARQNPGAPPAYRILFDNIFNDPNFNIDLENLPLPRNRPLASCRNLLAQLSNRRHGSVPGYAQPAIAPSPMMYAAPNLPPGSRKRPASVESGPGIFGQGRKLAPNPNPITKPTSSFAVGPNRAPPGSHPHSPLDNVPGSEHPARKKRGRPSKKDVEERKLAQLERQNMERPLPAPMLQQYYSSPLMAVQPGPVQLPQQTASQVSREAPTEVSAPQSPQLDTTATPRDKQAEADVNSSSSSGKKKRGRPPKVDTEAILPPTFSASASSAGAYGSPPQSGVSAGPLPRRLSISTRSQGPAAGPVHQEAGVQQIMGEDQARQQTRQRSWNDTVMGSSSNPNQRQQQP